MLGQNTVGEYLKSKNNNELNILENFYKGQAVGGDDCFFDAVAQGLKQLKPAHAQEFTVKSLRKICQEFAQKSLNDQTSLKSFRVSYKLTVEVPRDWEDLTSILKK